MLIIDAVGFIFGTLLSVFSPDAFWLIVSRFIIGLSIGTSSYIVPLFISEIAPAKRRGRLVLFNLIAITGGESIAFFVDYLLVPTHSWRLMFATGIVPALLLLIGMLFCPATPRWLMLKGRDKEAKATLQKIRNTHLVDTEFDAIKQGLDAKLMRFKEIFSKPLRPVLMIGLVMGILQQFVGINTVMYYGPVIFKHAGFDSGQTALLATFVMGMVNFLGSIWGVLLVDRIGRRPPLIIGTLLAFLSLGFIGLLFSLRLQGGVAHAAMLVLMVIYIAGYSISLGSLFWLMIAEIYPLKARGQAMSFVTGIQWAANFLVAVTFLSILHSFGPADTFWLYGLMCLIACLFVSLKVPETKGVSLEQIEHNLRLGRPTRQLGQPESIGWNVNVWTLFTGLFTANKEIVIVDEPQSGLPPTVNKLGEE